MKSNILLTAALIAVASASTVKAQNYHTDHNHAMPSQTAKAQTAGPRGGSLKQAGAVQLETVVSQGGIQMFVYDQNGQPVSVDRGRGAASVRVEGNAKRYRYDLLPDGKGGLTAPVNLSQIAGRQIDIDIQLVGIKSASGQTLTLNEVATVPASELQLAAAAIARQKICPVSGKPLDSMGDPVAVDVDGQRVFVCCGGCVNAVKSDPAKYAAGRPQITVATATAADADAIARQKVCPVMDEPLGGMGTPIKVTIGDKPIYLCCKGCIKKIEAEPAKYLAMVYGDQKTSAGVETVGANASSSNIEVTSATQDDAALIAQQKNCPVMDEPLGSMGDPIKVLVGDKAIYICCPGCAKKIAAEPQKWLAVLAQQGVNAPTLR